MHKDKVKEHTVRIQATDEEWTRYKILCISQGSSISEDLGKYVRSEAVKCGVNGRNK